VAHSRRARRGPLSFDRLSPLLLLLLRLLRLLLLLLLLRLLLLLLLLLLLWRRRTVSQAESCPLGSCRHTLLLLLLAWPRRPAQRLSLRLRRICEAMGLVLFPSRLLADLRAVTRRLAAPTAHRGASCPALCA
jgi:hypothetical protein